MPSFPPPRPPAPMPASPPFGLAVPAFPFPALALLAGRAQLGETRETVLACLVGARLALATMPPYRLTEELRRARATAALGWLAVLAVPDELRPTLGTLYEATGGGDASAIATALGALRAQAAPALDDDAATELDELRRQLRLAAADPPSGTAADHAAPDPRPPA